jgi:type VI secretion system secreted protein Hcp
MSVVDYFLKVDGIDGESLDSKHKNEIDVLSFSWSESQSGTMAAAGGGGAGKVSMKDLIITSIVSKASPALMLACATGEHIKKATLTCRKAGKEQQKYLEITLTDVIISSFTLGGSQGDVVPASNLSLNFTAIEFAYSPQKSDGSLDSAKRAGYDLKANKKI